ncbi:hypothetical protein D3C81_905020 [compost metagenome]
MRPSALAMVMLRMVLVINSEFGTISVERSPTWISVERTEMRRMSPSWSPIFTQSPIFTGRSASRIKPDTKFWVIACRPKPIPTDNALASSASFSKPTPSVASAHNTASTMPR